CGLRAALRAVPPSRSDCRSRSRSAAAPPRPLPRPPLAVRRPRSSAPPCSASPSERPADLSAPCAAAAILHRRTAELLGHLPANIKRVRRLLAIAVGALVGAAAARADSPAATAFAPVAHS